MEHRSAPQHGPGPPPGPAVVRGSVPPPGGWRELPAARPRRRWPWVLTVLLQLVVIAVLLAVAVDQRTQAGAWQDRAAELTAQREAAEQQGAELRARLDEAVDRLERSERDVGELEATVRQLADERNRAEDAVLTGEVERDALRELSGLIADAVGSLDACIQRLSELQAATAAAAAALDRGGATLDLDALAARSAEVEGFCEQARSRASDAGAAVDLLRR